MKRITYLLILLALLLTPLTPIWADTADALDWLRTKQAEDGGFAGDFDTASSTGATLEAIVAIVAAGDDPATWTQGDNTPLTFLESQIDTVTEPSDLAKAIIVVHAAGANPRDFGGVDLVTALQDTYDESSGIYGGPDTSSVFGQAFASLALAAVGQTTPRAAIDWLLDHQLDDGSWSWNGDTTPDSGDSNSTALVLQALVAVGDNQAAIDQGLAYLTAQQNDDGGFTYQKPSQFGTDTDANSTAYVIQGLIATGAAMSDWSKSGVSPVEALAALQKDNGAFQWQAALPDDNFLATVQAIPALAGQSFVDLIGPVEMMAETPTATPEPAPTATPAATNPPQLPATGGVQPWTLGLLLAGSGLMAVGWSLRRQHRKTE